MIHFTLLCVGKLKESYLRAAVADYVSRLSKYTKIDIVEVAEDIPSLQKELMRKALLL